MNQTILLIVNVANIFLLSFSAFNLLRRKHIVHLLIVFSIASLVILEMGKFGLAFDFVFKERLLGLGFCFLSIFWLIASISLLSEKSYSLVRFVLSPILGILSIVFFVIWWIRPFIQAGYGEAGRGFSGIEWYFFIMLIVNLSLALSNIERSVHSARNKDIRLFFASVVFLVAPYILLATHAVIFAEINLAILRYVSLSVFAGALLFLFVSRKGFVVEAAKETTAIHSSLTLFLIGGYLFLVGAFIKLFQAFGFSLQTLFSFLTTAFLLCVLVFFLFSSVLKERMKGFFFRYLSRQKYDWQKIWQDFTYKISLVTDLGQIAAKIKEAISKILNVAGVEVAIFDEPPFEQEFADWLLRRADLFKVEEALGERLEGKYPRAQEFFAGKNIKLATPLYGDRKIIGIIGFRIDNAALLDPELLKVLSLQASSVIVNCLAYQKLQEAEKKESIYRLSSFVIHDVKNYINNLSMLITNKDKFDKPEFQKDALFTLNTTIGRMKRLIDEFSALRGDLKLDTRAANMADIVGEVVRDMGGERLKGVTIEKKLDASIIIHADEHYIYKVILNVLLNAVEAMDGKGRLSLCSERSGGYALLSIHDTGVGMSKEFIQQRLFKPFQSTKAKGLGIGLHQCKTIIEAHAGSIEVSSEVGVGTTFIIKLPLSKS